MQKFYLSTWCRYQPEVNWRNPKLKEAMFDVMRFWLELGVDGYRIDVINWFMKDEQFRSNPFRPQLARPTFRNTSTTGTVRKPTTFAGRSGGWWMRFRIDLQWGRSTPNPQGMPLPTTERGTSSTSPSISPFSSRSGGLRISCRRSRSGTDCCETRAGRPTPCRTTINPGTTARYAEGDETDKRARVAAAMLLTLRGTPFLYYGEEIGMSDLKIREKADSGPSREEVLAHPQGP